MYTVNTKTYLVENKDSGIQITVYPVFSQITVQCIFTNYSVSIFTNYSAKYIVLYTVNIKTYLVEPRDHVDKLQVCKLQCIQYFHRLQCTVYSHNYCAQYIHKFYVHNILFCTLSTQKPTRETKDSDIQKTVHVIFADYSVYRIFTYKSVGIVLYTVNRKTYLVEDKDPDIQITVHCILTTYKVKYMYIQDKNSILITHILQYSTFWYTVNTKTYLMLVETKKSGVL